MWAPSHIFLSLLVGFVALIGYCHSAGCHAARFPIVEPEFDVPRPIKGIDEGDLSEKVEARLLALYVGHLCLGKNEIAFRQASVLVAWVQHPSGRPSRLVG